MNCQIYSITCKVNQEIYLGATQLPETRFQQYKRNYVNSISPEVKRSFRKYGKKNHSWKVIALLPGETNLSVLRKLERFYIQLYVQLGYKLMNRKKSFHTEEQIIKNKRRFIGKRFPSQRPKYLRCEDKTKSHYKERCRPVIEIDLKSGEIIKEWESVKAFCEEEKISSCNMSGHLSGRMKFFANKLGRKFLYKFHKPSRRRKSKKKQGDYSPKVVIQIDSKLGTVLNVYPSITEASKSTGVNQGNISSCCNGKLLTAGKFRWKFQEETKSQYVQETLNEWKRKSYLKK